MSQGDVCLTHDDILMQTNVYSFYIMSQTKRPPDSFQINKLLYSAPQNFLKPTLFHLPFDPVLSY